MGGKLEQQGMGIVHVGPQCLALSLVLFCRQYGVNGIFLSTISSKIFLAFWKLEYQGIYRREKIQV